MENLQNNSELAADLNSYRGRIHFFNAILGSDYIVESGELCRLIAKGGGNSETAYLLNGVLVAEDELVKDNGQDLERVLRVAFHCNNEKIIRDELPLKDLFNGNFAARFGLDFRPAVGRQKLQYIADSVLVQSPYVKRQTIYQQTGWRKIEDRWVFLHNGGAIGAEGIATELPGRAVSYEFPTTRTPGHEAALVKFLQIAPKCVVYPLAAVAFLSPLCEAFRRAGCEPSFILWLQGVTGTRKSTLSALVLNFFGAEWNNKTLPASFKDSANYLEKLGFQLADVPVVIDDYFPATNRTEASKMATTAQSIARCWGDRIGRNRMNSDTTLKRGYPARGMAICTGEDAPQIGQSGSARAFTVELKREDVNLVWLSELQKDSHLLAETMATFIEWLSPQYEELPKRLKARFLELRERAQNDGHGRTVEAVAHLQIGLEMMMEFLTCQNFCSAEESALFLDESWKVLQELAEEQARKLTDEKPTKLFLDALRELLATGACSVQYLGAADHPADNNLNPIGFRDRDFFYLYPDSVYAAIKRFFNQAERSFSLSKNQLYKHLAIEKLIETDSNQTTKAKKIRGKLARFLWLKASALEITEQDNPAPSGDDLDDLI